MGVHGTVHERNDPDVSMEAGKVLFIYNLPIKICLVYEVKKSDNSMLKPRTSSFAL